MGKVWIIKTGSASAWLTERYGDFEDWIIAAMALGRDDVALVDVCRNDDLPPWHAVAGVVITGSHAMVTDGHAWSRRTQMWLPGVVDRRIPVLGICFGHQLLASALGGRVADNPRGLEFGTVEVRLNPAGARDVLLGGLANPMKLHVCHTQSVIRLPPGAELLAQSANDPHQAFRYGTSAWGVQFHPEFRAGAMAYYIREYRDDLARQGEDVDLLLACTRETPWGSRILRRFGALTRSPGQGKP